MAYLAKYKKSDFKKVSWEEYGETLGKLCGKIKKYAQKNKIKIDAVAPILRAGAFPGTYLAYRLHILTVLPIQYHYHFAGKKIELRKLLDFSGKKSEFPQSPVLLLVEGNHCFGLTASVAAKDIKAAFPGCRIIYAADHMDYSYRKIENVDAIFYGKLTNETRALTRKECLKRGISPLSYLFPWEDLEEEWTTVQGKQFEYEDVEALKKGKLKSRLTL